MKYTHSGDLSLCDIQINPDKSIAPHHKFFKSFKALNLKGKKNQTKCIYLLGSKIRWSMLYLEKKSKATTWQGYIFTGMEDHKEPKHFLSIIFLSLFFGRRVGLPNLPLGIRP